MMKKILFTITLLIFLSLPQSASADITTGLVGWWKLDGMSGLAAGDSASSPHQGTFNIAPNWGVAGQRGTAVSITGTQSASTAYDVGTLNDFSACTWFLSSSDTASQRILDASFSGAFWVGHETTGAANKWGGGIMEGGSPFGIFITLTNGSWHHICSVRSGTTHFIYGDGGAVSTSNTVSGATLGGPNSFYMGSSNSGANFFNGSIDDVRLYNRALTAADVYELYSTNQSVPRMILNAFMTLWGNLTIF